MTDKRHNPRNAGRKPDFPGVTKWATTIRLHPKVGAKLRRICQHQKTSQSKLIASWIREQPEPPEDTKG